MLRKTNRRKAFDKIDRLYDSFGDKDMSRTEFRRRYLAATDAKRMQRDLSKIVKRRSGFVESKKMVAQHQKQAIDRAILEN